MVQEAKDANQESAFFSEVVAPGTVEDANPGLEVYFNRVLTEEEVDKVTKFINSTKVDVGFTFATDLRQAQMEAGGEQLDSFVGVRLQYIPELAAKGQKGSQEATDKILDLVDLLPEDMDFVSSAQYTEYDTEIFFRDAGDYDAELTGSVRQGRRAKWRGEQVSKNDQVTDGSP